MYLKGGTGLLSQYPTSWPEAIIGITVISGTLRPMFKITLEFWVEKKNLQRDTFGSGSSFFLFFFLFFGGAKLEVGTFSNATLLYLDLLSFGITWEKNVKHHSHLERADPSIVNGFRKNLPAWIYNGNMAACHGCSVGLEELAFSAKILSKKTDFLS